MRFQVSSKAGLDYSGRDGPSLAAGRCSGALPAALWQSSFAWLICLALFAAGLADAHGAVYVAEPGNYTERLAGLAPGDRLRFPAGVYRAGLRIHGLRGTAAQPIVIEGMDADRSALLLGREGQNTISIRDSAYVVVRHFEVDGQGALVDAVKAEGNAEFAHHIRIENLHIHSFARHQQVVGISTKCPAWAWAIIGNRIERLGTGIYLGDSDGSAPFVGGLIENNVVVDTIGYNLQIKHQLARPPVMNRVGANQRTIIRHNRFRKAQGAAVGAAARPNVLVGHFPLAGPGVNDEYVIYGNYFLSNRHEALFQGEGNIALYNNILVAADSRSVPAVAIQPHNDRPRRIRIFFNSVVHPGVAIRIIGGDTLVGTPADEQVVVGNLIFANVPIRGGMQADNARYPFDHFTAEPTSLDEDPCAAFREVPRGEGEALDLKSFDDLPHYRRDFNGHPRDPRVRGACMVAGSEERTNE